MKNLLILTLMLFFTSCNEIEHGRIVDKEYYRTHTDYNFEYDFIWRMPRIKESTIPSKFVIVILGKVDDKWKCEYHNVDSLTYVKLETGDTFYVDKINISKGKRCDS